ncbi:MAG: cobalamin B12-binding domain-containing protein [Deltaproteobacteria bacterium]|nr:cobalamin B12-binding domain-containing protein [Deltaproteobacteria bacterium]
MTTAAVAPPHATETFALRHKVRFVTAASLFDGHDAAIQIMRRVLQQEGAEVIHLGHDRSVQDVVDAAVAEDAQGIAVSSYQGGHVEYFSYMLELLAERGASQVRVYGGGGGVIVPEEIRLLEGKGVAKIFSPEDGRRLGLVGMIRHMLAECDRLPGPLCARLPEGVSCDKPAALARAITTLELGHDEDAPPEARQAALTLRADVERRHALLVDPVPIVGFTGTGGAGKSSLIDEVLLRFLAAFPNKRVAVLSVDPTRRRTGGALLGDRIRMNASRSPRVFVRSLATRRAHSATSPAVKDALALLQLAGFDLVILETAGIGQSDSAVADLVGTSVYVMTPEFGAPSQLDKIDMLDFADLVVINKSDKRGAQDALRDVRKVVQRNRKLFDQPAEAMPVFATAAHRFHDGGTNALFNALLARLNDKSVGRFTAPKLVEGEPSQGALIPAPRTRYLGEIADTVRARRAHVEAQALLAERADACRRAAAELPTGDPARVHLLQRATQLHHEMDAEARAVVDGWDELAASVIAPRHSYTVRGKEIHVDNYRETLAHTAIPKVSLPALRDAGARVRFAMRENVPGSFPYTAGVFPYKRTGEDPTRMFAGEGTPERTNRRFHYVSGGQPAVRLSTAFDSVTLYGADPHERPDIYGKIGNSGVSVCCLDDAKRLYSGFDLCAPSTSVSMTINGPAPTMLACFMNAAIDAAIERRLKREGTWGETERQITAWFAARGQARPVYRGELPPGHDGNGLGFLGVSSDRIVDRALYDEVRQMVLRTVRGTVQADILKEDQAQNTCIFSTEFALRMMGDVQAWFVEQCVQNFYSVSISGYHIAEAGANPVTQLAFTLANGFTLVEYYRARGMKIDDFAPNLSFFFSNGLDAEYAVIGRVARRIWSVAMRDQYGANERSQKLKYHIQTSGRSLHAQEMAFNDIRTTLQALYAIADNCNSLHTNAYDEAVTTPTQESVRRAIAIQLIINRELGYTKNENPLQGSAFIERLTDVVEGAVLAEFEALDQRGGVLGAMETMYQRGKIQDESLVYESKKHSGELPIVGVNTFLPDNEADMVKETTLIRSSEDEKQAQIDNVRALEARFPDERKAALARLQDVARAGGNVFGELMETVKTCSIGSISQALFDVGGAYRRSM